MFFRILAGVALVSLSYYIGREMGRTHPIRERLREKKLKDSYSETSRHATPHIIQHATTNIDRVATNNVADNTVTTKKTKSTKKVTTKSK